MSTVKRVSGEYTIQSIGASDPINLISPSVNIEGNLTVTGNAVLVGNINADKIFNGTTSIEIPVTGGNANVTIGGTSNVVVWATTGEYVTGLQSVTGNITGGNLRTAGQVSATGDVTGANINVSGNVLISRDASIGQPTIRFTDTDTTVSDGQVLGAVEWFTSDVSPPGSPRVTSGIRAVASGVLGNANIQILTSTNGAAATAKVVVDNVGNVGIANAAPLDTLAVTGTAYVSGNITGGNFITGGFVSATGNVLATGNVTGGNVITAGLATVTGNITGGNIISVGAVSAGAAGISTTGNVTGGNVNSNGLISATGNVTGANVVGTLGVFSGNLSATANTVTSNLQVTGNSYGTGIGVENIVWQPTTVAFASATMANVGSLGFLALAGSSYKFEAYMPILIDGGGATATGFGTRFDAGVCYYTVEFQTTQTSTFNTATSNVSGVAPATASMSGATPRTARITGTIYSAGNANVTIQAQTAAANIGIQSGAFLTYTRIS